MKPAGKKKQSLYRRLRIYLIAVPLLALVSFAAVKLTQRNVSARLALTEAQDAQLVLTLLAVEYYGDGESVYDPSAATGLAPGVMDEVAELAELSEGEIYLLEWDEVSWRPAKMMYITDGYVCMYGLDEYEPGLWSVVRNRPLLRRQRLRP